MTQLPQIDPVLMRNLIRELGMDALEPQEQERTIQAVGDILFQRVLLRIIDMLPQEVMLQLSSAMESEEQNPGATLQFLRAHIPNFDVVVTAEVAEFKEDAIGVMDAARLQAEL